MSEPLSYGPFNDGLGNLETSELGTEEDVAKWGDENRSNDVENESARI